jgi:internalin A
LNRITFSLLVLGLLLAPVLCWAAEPNPDQAKAIAWIEKLGGKVTVDEKSPGKPVNSVNLRHTKVSDTELDHLRGLPQLQRLSLGNMISPENRP